MNHCCGNCQWWQGREDPDCMEAECRASSPCMIPDENAWVQDRQNGCNVPVHWVAGWPITQRDQLACGAHVFVGSVNIPIVLNPEPLSEGEAESVAHECKMNDALEAFDLEWREAHGSLPAQDVRRLVRHAIEWFLGKRT